MPYFLILGSHPTLSTAEALAVLPPEASTDARLIGPVLLFETHEELDLSDLMNRLGGTIKAGYLFDQPTENDLEKLAGRLAKEIPAEVKNERVVFGYSIYSSEPKQSVRLAKRLSRLGMEIKRLLKEAGGSVRWVRPSTGPELTSVSVAKNRLLDGDGIELALIERPEDHQILVGRTIAVQPFQKFSNLDYGRPERDARRGMLPPKLARMMVNLADLPTGNNTLWDPYCGSGTILSEALQLGATDIYGSDRDRAAVEATEKNLAWISEKTERTANISLFAADATEASKEIPDGSIKTVVAEPFLGTPRDGQERRPELYRRLDELTELYARSVLAWRDKLADGAKVVLALPVYLDENRDRLGVDLQKILAENYRADQTLPPDLLDKKQTGPNGGLLYGRPGQFVWREIVRLKRI